MPLMSNVRCHQHTPPTVIRLVFASLAALVATVLPLIALLLWAWFQPSQPDDDGALRGGAFLGLSALAGAFACCLVLPIAARTCGFFAHKRLVLLLGWSLAILPAFSLMGGAAIAVWLGAERIDLAAVEVVGIFTVLVFLASVAFIVPSALVWRVVARVT